MNASSTGERESKRRGAGMSHVNKKNAEMNFNNAFRNVTSRPDGSKLNATGLDPFSRRKTQSQNYWSTKRGQPTCVCCRLHACIVSCLISTPPRQTSRFDSIQSWSASAAGGEDETAVVTDPSQLGMDALAQSLDGPTAAAVIKDGTGDVALDIDVSVLSLPQAPPLAKKLLGKIWQTSLSALAVPADLATKKLLTMTDYKRRQGIA